MSDCKPVGGNASILDRRNLQSCSPQPPQAWREEAVLSIGPALHYNSIGEKIRHVCFVFSLFIHGRQILLTVAQCFFSVFRS